MRYGCHALISGIEQNVCVKRSSLEVEKNGLCLSVSLSDLPGSFFLGTYCLGTKRSVRVFLASGTASDLTWLRGAVEGEGWSPGLRQCCGGPREALTAGRICSLILLWPSLCQGPLLLHSVVAHGLTISCVFVFLGYSIERKRDSSLFTALGSGSRCHGRTLAQCGLVPPLGQPVAVSLLWWAGDLPGTVCGGVRGSWVLLHGNQ